MKAIRSLQPKASTRPASSARQPARSSFVIEWSCCWSRHHSMREMILLGSYFMGPSWANVSLPPATRNYPKLGGMYYQVNPSIWGGGKPAREGGPTSTFIPICRCFTKPKTRSLLAPLTLFEEHIGIDNCMLFIPTE